MSVSLGALRQRAQTRLDGFEARALGSEAAVPRHLYTTEWASLSPPPLRSVSFSGPVLVLGEEVLGLEGAECVDARAWTHCAQGIYLTDVAYQLG